MSDEEREPTTEDQESSGDDSYAAYSKLDGVTWTNLKEMRRSPLHYAYRLAHPLADRPTLALGRAAHTAILEPEKFARDFAVFSGKGTRASAEWKAFAKENPTKTLLKSADYDNAMRLADVVRSHPVAGPYLEVGSSEQTVQWIDPATGLPCKARLDYVSASRQCIAELKSSADIEPRIFASTVARMGYHAQVAHQQSGWAAVDSMLPVVIIAVEKVSPYDVIVWEMGEETLRVGRTEVARLLARVKECTEANHWPGRFDERQTLQLPTYLLDDQEITV